MDLQKYKTKPPKNLTTKFLRDPYVKKWEGESVIFLMCKIWILCIKIPI
jgi:hypothetical protein